MSVIESIGARYIPVVADPVEWNSETAYEHLTIVQHLGDTYVSKTDVPSGIDIANETYWIRFATFNAQYETLRHSIEENSSDIDSMQTLLNITQTQLVAETTQQTVGKFTSNGFIGEIYILVEAEDQTAALWAGASGVETFKIICPESIKPKAINLVNKYCFLRHDADGQYITITKNVDVQFTDDVIFNFVTFIN